MSLLVQNVRLLDETRDIPRGWLRVDGDRIGELGEGEPPQIAAEGGEGRPTLVIDGAGLVLAPSFVELHAHFRDPGRLDKERLESGCLAAAAGGYGTVVTMANTTPAMCDPVVALDQRRRAAALGLVDLYPVLGMSRGLLGREAGHLGELAALLKGSSPASTEAEEGLRVLSEDGKDIENEELYLEVLRAAADLDLLVSCHCEAAGAADSREAEELGVARAIRLGRQAGCRLHIAHVSTRGSVELLRRAKAETTGKVPAGFRLSCEASPHHLALTETDAIRLGSGGPGRVNPPLRSENDREALLEAVRDGTIDAIATDHAPHTPADKEAGSPGFVGLETSFGLLCAGLGESLGLSALSRLMSASPARILGLSDRGRLEPGMRADLVLLDPEASWTVEPERFKSRGKNSPVAGRRLRGRVLMTLSKGRICHDAR